MLAVGCAGTESPIFESTALKPDAPVPSVTPPSEPDDAAGPMDAGDPWLPVPPLVDPGDEDGGTAVDPGLDPNADFTWTETLPGAGTCKPGRYVGGFECTMPGLGGLPVSISGEIAFTLTGSPEEQRLEVEEGSITGFFFNAVKFMGALECTRDRFSAWSTEGMFVLGTTASSSLTGLFDSQSLVIEGGIRLIDDQTDTCDGTFGVGIAP